MAVMCLAANNSKKHPDFSDINVWGKKPCLREQNGQADLSRYRRGNTSMELRHDTSQIAEPQLKLLQAKICVDVVSFYFLRLPLRDGHL